MLDVANTAQGPPEIFPPFMFAPDDAWVTVLCSNQYCKCKASQALFELASSTHMAQKVIAGLKVGSSQLPLQI